MNLKDVNNNILSNRWKARYMTLPDETKKKLDSINENWTSENQLRVIKKKRQYPKVGDIFEINPQDEIILYGIVVNNYVTNINGENLLVVFIFKEGVDIKECIRRGVSNEDILIPPQIVGKEYWTRGYFYNVEHFNEKISVGNYGFYRITDRNFLDEYGNQIKGEPQLLGTYGVVTTIGIARKIRRELIIAGIL